MTAATMPTGTLMKKTQCQERVSASTPPSAGPIAAPMDEPRSPTPRPKLVMCNGRNFTLSITEDAASIDAPTPWTALAASSTTMSSDSPHASDARLNTRKPAIMIFLMAPLSQSLPNIRTSPARTRKYTVTIQDDRLESMPKDSEMSGRATLTIVPSRPSRNMPSAIVTRSGMCALA